MKKVVVLGGGTGMSTLLKGLKLFPLDITAVVSVCDDGNSTGRLREEFNIPAVGDIRKVIVSLSETEPLFEKLLNYRFQTTSDLDGHTIGNLLLTALINISGNMSDGIKTIEKVLKLKGKVLPLTEDSPTLIADMKDGSFIKGEHHITESMKEIQKVYYEKKPSVNPEVIKEIKKADLIILSMGSLYTSIIPNLLIPEVVSAIDESKAKIMYICNMMTQPGETDDFKASDHVNALNSYLGKKKISIVIANNGPIPEEMIKKYWKKEQKSPVLLDKENLKNLKLIDKDYVAVVDNVIRYQPDKLALDIYGYLIEEGEK